MSTLISITEAAEQLSLTPQQVRRMCSAGKIQAEKVGRAWVVDSESKSFQSLLPHQDKVPSKARASKKPIALSFFSGAMGLDLGLEEAGFDIKLACEFDKHAQNTIRNNKPDVSLIGDITDYGKKEILELAGLNETDEIDLIAGGPPCQAFSTAGNRQGFNDVRGNVFLHYIELALEMRPKFIMIENVRGLLSAPMKHRPHSLRGEGFPELNEDELKGGALNFVLSELDKSGYSYSFNLYNSANYGTPQIRERVIIICSRDGDTPPFIPPTHSDDPSFGLKPWRTFRDVSGGIEEHHHLNFPEKRLKYYRLLKGGQNWRNLPENLQKEAMGKSYYSGGGKTGFLRRISYEKPSPTLVTHPAMPATDLAHPEEDRPLSVEEYKRIQEFPDNWDLSGSLIEQYKQVGNAVPFSLGFAAGKLIVSLIEKQPIHSIQGFSYSRYKNTDHVSWRTEFNKLKKAKEKSLNEQKELAF